MKIILSLLLCLGLVGVQKKFGRSSELGPDTYMVSRQAATGFTVFRESRVEAFQEC